MIQNQNCSSGKYCTVLLYMAILSYIIQEARPNMSFTWRFL